MVRAAHVGDAFDALLVHVHVAGRALESLMNETVEERAAVITEGRGAVRVLFELVLRPGVLAAQKTEVDRANVGRFQAQELRR